METVTETCVVETTAGALQGRIETPGSGVAVFKGVNYGADTASARFEPPRPPVPWTGVRDAFAYGGTSPQPPGPRRGPPAPPQSEDCLVLNVWAPAAGAVGDGGGRAGRFWEAGGGFTTPA